jgi:hypothetical protein
MSWTLLQFISFEQGDYNLLLNALKDSGIDDSEIDAAEVDEPGIDENISTIAPRGDKSIKVAIQHTPAIASATPSNVFRSTFKIPASCQSIIPSSTNDTNDCASPEYLSPAPDGRWHIHVGGNQRLMDLAESNPEPLPAGSHNASVPTKRKYLEDVEDLYGVSPPPKVQ